MKQSFKSVKKSKKLFQKAQKLLPGGVNSPVRAFKAVGEHPLFIEKAQGAYIYDVDDNKYLDFVGSWGPMLLGHNHPQVLRSIRETLKRGTSFGAPCELELRMAEHLIKRIPSLEKVRLVNSGTEAVMGAVRVARGFTGRNKILKFVGCYHGHSDYLLVKAGSGAMTLGSPDSLGVPKSFAKETLVADYNDLEQVKSIVKKHGKDMAAIIVEPIAGNMGLVLPKPGFLEGLRELCDRYGIVFIFDEVMTGFRVHKAGAQGLYKIRPDLTCLGKIIGGGLPVGAYGGRKDIMTLISPEGPVYQAGTLSGNPLAMAAGLATLELSAAPGFYQDLKKKTQYLVQGLKQAAQAKSLPIQVPYVCGMLCVYFSEHPIEKMSDIQASAVETFAQFHQHMLKSGVYLPPSAYESWFISSQHSGNRMAKVIDRAREAFECLPSV